MARKSKTTPAVRSRARWGAGWAAISPAKRPAVVARIRAESAALQRFIEMRRLHARETVCRGILDFPADPRRGIAEQMLRWIATAREHLVRGHDAAPQLLAIERLVRQGNDMILRPMARRGEIRTRGLKQVNLERQLSKASKAAAARHAVETLALQGLAPNKAAALIAKQYPEVGAPRTIRGYLRRAR